MDYLIWILVEDVEPDFMRAHVRCGLGFTGCRLCKAENEAKKIAESIPFDEAEEALTDKGNNEVKSISFVCTGQFFSEISPFLAVRDLFHSR